jgi:hypothetical protein
MPVTRYHEPNMARYDQEHVTHMSYDGPWPILKGDVLVNDNESAKKLVDEILPDEDE